MIPNSSTVEQCIGSRFKSLFGSTMKYTEAECLVCSKKELLPLLPNIHWLEWPFVHENCEKDSVKKISVSRE